MLQTLPRLLSGKWSLIGFGHPTPWWSMCIPTKEIVIVVNVKVLFLLLLWYLQYPRFDRRHQHPMYLHTWFNLITDIAIQLVPVISHPPWPSHMLQHWMNLNKWAQSIFCQLDDQILLLVHTPLPTPLAYPIYTFSLNPVTVETVDAIKVASRCSDYRSDLTV
jgi:hypothetical protein